MDVRVVQALVLLIKSFAQKCDMKNDMKNVNDIETFKSNIRKWKPVNCHCKLCLDYVSCVGYVNTF